MTDLICFQCLTDPNAYPGSDDLPNAKAFTLLEGTALCKKHARDIGAEGRRALEASAPVHAVFPGADA